MADDRRCDPTAIFADARASRSSALHAAARVAQASAQPVTGIARGPHNALEVRTQETPLLELLEEVTDEVEVEETLAARLDALLHYARANAAGMARGLYKLALELDPHNLAALRGIADDAYDAGAWAEAVVAQQKVLAAMDGDGRAEALHRLGDLQLRLGDERRARTTFERALEHDETFVPARRSLLELDLEDHAWSRVIEHEDALLAILDAGAERRSLLREIADRWADRDPERAGDALELILDLEPGPLDVTHLDALYRQFARTGQRDRAYCVAAALVFLHGADAEQRACAAEQRPRGVPRFSARLGRTAFLGLGSGAPSQLELDRALAGVFEAIARPASALKRRATITRATREDRDRTTLLAAKAYFGAASVLGLDAQLFVQRDLPGGITALPVDGVASLMGSSLLAGWSPPELMFVLGKHLATRVGEHFVCAHFPSVSELEVLLAAAVHVVSPSRFSSARATEITRLSARLAQALTPEERLRLGRAVGTFVALLPTDPDGRHVVRYLQRSELIAARAGLLLCGDLSVAATILSQEPVVPGDLSPSEKMKDLVRFSVSDAYAELRRALGIDVRRRRDPASEESDDDEPTRERKLCA